MNDSISLLTADIIVSPWNAEGGVPYNFLFIFVAVFTGAQCAPSDKNTNTIKSVGSAPWPPSDNQTRIETL